MPYIKPISPEKLISLAGEGYTYNQASRLLKHEAHTVRAHAKRLMPQVHERFIGNGLARQYTQGGNK